ncbi:MAG: hypothetical protein IJ688_14110 [Treponema sp.]|nr:hypothetical protein [Treponema sp.]
MKKHLFRFTFCLVFLPLFFAACASTPDQPVPETENFEITDENESEADITADEAEDETDTDETEEKSEAEEETETDQTELSPETEDLTETDATTETEDSSSDSDAEIEEQTDAEKIIDENNESEEETDESDTESEENQLEEIEEPEVITVEYEEEVSPKVDEEEIDSEELDLDYVDVIDDDEDDEIRGEIDVIEVEESDDSETETPLLEEENNPPEEIIEASRKVSMKLQEYVDITYPGSGWIYIGLTDGSKALSYFGRKLGTKDTKFTLQAKSAGIKYVHFYRVDPLTDEYIDDFIEIEISDEKGSNKTHITAPEYKPPLPKKAKEFKKTETVENALPEIEVSESVSTEESQTETPVSVQETTEEKIEEKEQNTIEKEDENQKIDVNSLLKEAQLLYNNKDYSSADKKIKTFLDYAVTDRDAGLFLQGQILEAKSEIQDIKSAIEAYRTLTKNYPASQYWEKANKQIIYLNRFYLEIR